MRSITSGTPDLRSLRFLAGLIAPTGCGCSLSRAAPGPHIRANRSCQETGRHRANCSKQEDPIHGKNSNFRWNRTARTLRHNRMSHRTFVAFGPIAPAVRIEHRVGMARSLPRATMSSVDLAEPVTPKKTITPLAVSADIRRQRRLSWPVRSCDRGRASTGVPHSVRANAQPNIQ